MPRLLSDLLEEDGLAGIAHDLKGPLSTIDLEAQLIERRGQDPATNRSLAVIRQNVAFMDRLVHNLLELSSVGGLRTQRCSLATVIERVVERSVSMPDRDRIRVEMCDPAVAFIDPSRIERVVANLLHNALTFSVGFSPVVVRLETYGDRACVSVIDTGPGLSEDDARHAFEPSRRGG